MLISLFSGCVTHHVIIVLVYVVMEKVSEIYAQISARRPLK